jgi:hypothetical protein
MKREYSEEPSILRHWRKVRRSIYSVKCRRYWMAYIWSLLDDDDWD